MSGIAKNKNDSKKTKIIAADKDQLIDPKLLQLLVCPLTKHSLDFDSKKNELISKSARLAYPVRGGIPIMLPSEARALEDSEL